MNTRHIRTIQTARHYGERPRPPAGHKARRSAVAAVRIESLSASIATQDRQSESVRIRRRRQADKKFEDMMQELSGNQDHIDDVNDYLNWADRGKDRQRRLLHKRWAQEVHKPIQARIQQQLDDKSCSEIEARHYAAAEEFVDVINRKAGGEVFRDIILESDYDPLKWNRGNAKYSVRGIKDPVKQDLREASRERAMLAKLNPDRRISRPTSRNVLDIKLWDRLESTPYVRYEGAVGCGKKLVGGRVADQLQMDHYHVSSDPALVKAQYFVGGKHVHGPAVRRDNDVITWKARAAPGKLPRAPSTARRAS